MRHAKVTIDRCAAGGEVVCCTVVTGHRKRCSWHWLALTGPPLCRIGIETIQRTARERLNRTNCITNSREICALGSTACLACWFSATLLTRRSWTPTSGRSGRDASQESCSLAASGLGVCHGAAA